MAGTADPRDPKTWRRFVAPGLFVLLVAGTYLRSHPDAPAPDRPAAQPEVGAANPTALDVTELSGAVFGTTFSVKVVSPSSAPIDEQAAAQTIQRELNAIDASMSTWKDDSELSRLNRAQVGQAVVVSPPLFAVLDLAAQVHTASGGAFDVTVGPLVNRWGFGPDGRPSSAPTDAELATLRASVGQSHLVLDPAGPTATRQVDGLSADLSAIAKGYAVDRVSQALRDLGHDRHMVEIGGEIRASGENGDGRPWRIAIEKPDSLARTPFDVVGLSDEAMATSGDYRNVVELDGQRLSHTIDPRTGRPVTHGLASVTVVAPTCAAADAWATALSVLGPIEGATVADAHDVAATFLVRTDSGFTQSATRAYQARFAAH